ncbi:PEP/pyruvate-binding domain-containing protein [Pseudonocardia xishanensis]|uniref:Pyruvate phosphate dikinase AMP/ATP-binding domain-containing protein n=1 Tax=Pseudonocardia xishanensis TaxID=630995 RepID=A0ABP8S3U1_9PSEU
MCLAPRPRGHGAGARGWAARGRAYRAHEGIADDLGTGVTVEAMVFGNRDAESGTGVVFSRDPSTGENRPYGDFLPRAQGEDVVAGTTRTLTLADMASLLPEAHRELTGRLALLERHYRDLCDVEFTVEQGRLSILQTRVGKRGAVAAVRVAAAMLADPATALTPAEVRARITDEVLARARTEVLTAARQGAVAGAVARGLARRPVGCRGPSCSTPTPRPTRPPTSSWCAPRPAPPTCTAWGSRSAS